MTNASNRDPIVIWPFETVQGGCRLSLQVPREQASELRNELMGCAVVAESFEEFVSLAARAIRRAGGTIGDVLRQPVPTPPLTSRLRAAARVSDVLRARDYILRSFREAKPDEVERLFGPEGDQAAVSYLASVAHSLDEARSAFVAALAAEARLPLEAIDEILQAHLNS
jgi:hypothetical protein